jgi:hypothetical protein
VLKPYARLKATVKGHGSYAEVNCVACSHDGTMMASAAEVPAGMLTGWLVCRPSPVTSDSHWWQMDIKIWDADRIYGVKKAGENLMHRMRGHTDLVTSPTKQYEGHEPDSEPGSP